MIKYNNKAVAINHFPDGTILMKENVALGQKAEIIWHFENNEELDRYIREGIQPEESVKNRIDEMHVKNLFKLEAMPCFEMGGQHETI